ncbi:hypothetical protein AB6813_09295 [bacterium RCC_150]
MREHRADDLRPGAGVADQAVVRDQRIPGENQNHTFRGQVERNAAGLVPGYRNHPRPSGHMENHVVVELACLRDGRRAERLGPGQVQGYPRCAGVAKQAAAQT